MYKLETITRPDGSKYVQRTSIPKKDHEAWLELIRLLEQEPQQSPLDDEK